jgi:carbonic anhydrase/acetyltransferase-like protein (isoleucine patch superfamily)
MAIIKTLRGITPKFGNNCFLADNAVVAGDVIMGDDCSVWFNAVVRGDVHYIRIGNRVNIQDGAIIHCTYQKAFTVIGNNVFHRPQCDCAWLHTRRQRSGRHGCHCNGSCCGRKESLVAAGSVVLENTRVETGSIYAGVPAKKVKALSPEHFEQINMRIANNYIMYAEWYK